MQFSLRQMLVLLLATAFVASVLTIGQNGARLLTTASIGILFFTLDDVPGAATQLRLE